MSLKLPTVSIIVFAYEQIGYLPATLNSILQQTYLNYEALIFSDNRDWLAEYFGHNPDSRLQPIFQKNSGISQTFNQGIVTAKGEYISLLLAGDLWHPNKLQKQVSHLDYYQNVGLIHSWLLFIDHQDQSINKTINHRCLGLINREILIYDNINLSSVMIRRSCFDVVGLFDPKLQIVPDWDLWLRLSDYYQFMMIAESLVYCRKYQRRIAENFLVAETDLQITIEKAYIRPTAALLGSKNLSYSRASLFLAAKVLEAKESDPAIASNYCYQALQHYPLISFNPEFFQLRLAIIALYCRQSDRYSRLLQFWQNASTLLKEKIYWLGEYFLKLLHWLLEEDNLIFGKIRRKKIRDRKLGNQK